MLRVLLIEDEPLIAWIVEDWLKAQGHSVRVASSNNDASRLMSEGIDVAIVDFMLREEDATASMTELARRGIPYLLVSGSTFLDDQRFAGIPVLAKPIDFDLLASALMRMTTAGRQTGPPRGAPVFGDDAAAM